MKNKIAFSILELSAVILVIGLIIAGITQAGNMIYGSKIASARSTTSLAPVKDISGAVAWYETTMENSFIKSEVGDGKKISTWYNLLSSQNNALQATSGLQPVYADGILNGLPALKFPGALMTVVDLPDFTNATIFMAVSLNSLTTNNFVISKHPNFNFVFSNTTGYSVDFPSNRTNNSVSSVPISSTQIISLNLTAGSNPGIQIYKNGTSILSTDSSGNTSSTNAFSIGSTAASSSPSFNGQFGELIIFNRVLSDAERKDVENYLGKKWGITIS